MQSSTQTQAPTTTPTASPSATPTASSTTAATEASKKAPKKRRGINVALPEAIVAEIHDVADALELKPRKVAGFVKDVLLGHLAGLGSVKTVAKRALAARLADLDDDTEESPTAA